MKLKTFLLIYSCKKTKPILIGNVYRPPDQSGFLDKLSNAILNTTNFDSQEVYILGDLNINLNYAGTTGTAGTHLP